MAQAQTVAVVGLGYVGLPVAIAFAEKYNVIGIDTNEQKIQSLMNHHDPTGEVPTHVVKQASISFSTDPALLQTCDYIIVAVPTPITASNEPDLSFLIEASKMIGTNIKQGSVVIYESTVYPGTTEEVCIPILETYASLVAGVDFFVGYSPERINPGDQEHTFSRNTKIIAGQNDVAIGKISSLYKTVLESPVHEAPSIQVAETAKIVENAQRDMNIAFMNELAMICNELDINTKDVLAAASTKWNFAPFQPGLVGGHCIGVDPHYLIYRSKQAGYDPTFLSAARAINDSMPQYIVDELLHTLVTHAYNLEDLQVTVLGATFKENIADSRNSKALEIVHLLKKLYINVQIVDPYVSQEELRKQTRTPVTSYDALKKADVVIVAVSHDEFSDQPISYFTNLLKENKRMIMDIKGILSEQELPSSVTYWTL